MNPSLVLENELLLEFENFKRGKKHNKKTIQRLLHYYKDSHIFNKEQKDFLSKNKIELEKDELDIWINSGLFDLSLEELVKYTKFKIILSKDKSEFPFVNIFNDKLENNFTATFKSGEPRTKAVKHFTSLFYNAQSIFIFDKYIKRTGLEYLIRECKVNECVDKIKIVSSNIAESGGGIKQNTQIMGVRVQVVANGQNYNKDNTHDRYINIDDKIEIILTSGLDNFQNASKDFTYIVREIK